MLTKIITLHALEITRSIFYQNRSSNNEISSVSILKIVITIFGLLIVYSLSFFTSDLVVKLSFVSLADLQYLSVLLIHGMCLIISLLVVVSYYYEYTDVRNEYLRSLPLRQIEIYLAVYINSIMEISFFTFVTISPIITFILNIFNTSIFNIAASIIIPLILIFIYGLSFQLLVASILTIFKKIKMESLFVSASLIIAVFGFCSINIFTDPGNLLSHLYDLNNSLKSSTYIGFFLNLFRWEIAFEGFIYGFMIAGLSIGMIFVNSFLLQKIQFENRSQVEFRFKGGSFFPKLSYLGNTGAFLKKELLQISRSPIEILKNVLLLFLFSFVVLKLFSEGSNALVMFVVYSIPLSLCGILILHSVGNEGSNIYIIKLVASINTFLKTKIFIGIIFILPIVLITAIIIMLVFMPGIGIFDLLIRLVLLIIDSILGIIFTVSFGSTFADFNIKRMFPSIGIKIFGEILFWFCSGLFAFTFYSLDLAFLFGKENFLYLGYGLFLASIMVTLFLYKVSEYTLNHME